MSQPLSRQLSLRALDLKTADEVRAFIADAERDLGGIGWRPLGDIANNVHTAEVASDPALALVERPINGIDALLDLRARELGQTADTPHAAARAWWAVPAGGVGKLPERDRLALADNLRVTMLESGETRSPTVEIRDGGTGQHPDDFGITVLSLLASNKKEKRHQMGVYNAGGAASYRFSAFATITSRLAPQLLAGRADETGFAIVRYNELDPERFKTGQYEYLTTSSSDIIRLDMPDGQLPEVDGVSHLPHGTIVRLVQYELPRYARAAQEPKTSLWHLLHAALPDPALPIRIIETRAGRFPGVRNAGGGVTRRVVNGLLHLLGRAGTSEYSDERSIDLGPDIGDIVLRYYVINEGSEPDAYTTADQGMTVTLNGQRQIVRSRQWLKRNTDLPFLYNRLVVIVDGTGLTNRAKRQMFSSTRESGVDSDVTELVLERTLEELRNDDALLDLDEAARQRVIDKATATTSEKIKKQMASAIGRYLRGPMTGPSGGRKRRARRPRRPPGPGPVPPDDSLMLDVPDQLRIVEPVTIVAGATASLRLDINAKNDFLPDYADGLTVVLGGDLARHVRVRSKGRLLGGRTRITLIADADAPPVEGVVNVALAIPELGVLLTDSSLCTVVAPLEDDDEPDEQGGEPDISIVWVKREGWPKWNWNDGDVGECNIIRDPEDRSVITKVEWFLNEAYKPLEVVGEDRRTQSEAAFNTFRENYQYPVAFALFRQQLAADERQDDPGDDETAKAYYRGERGRLAQAVLMSMEPELTAVAIAVD
jgi:hypothetical protein